MIRPRMLSIIALSLALTGLVAGATLLALIALDVLPRLSPLWAGLAVLVIEMPSLALALPARQERLGRSALILASSLLAITAGAMIVLTPTQVSGPSFEVPTIDETTGVAPFVPETTISLEV